VSDPRITIEPAPVVSHAGSAPEVLDARPSRALAAAILDTVAEAVIVFDPASWLIGDVNRGAAELMGRPQEDLIGLPMLDLLPPAEVKRFSMIAGLLAAGERDKATVMMPYDLPNGDTISVEIVLQPVALSGGGRGVVAIARDITERIEVQVRLQRLAQSEHARAAELNAVIRAMGEAVVVCAADGSISLTNPAAEQIFPDVEEQSYAEILAQLHDPDGHAPALGTAGGPVVLATRADPGRCER